MRWVARCIVVLLAVSVQVVLADRAPPLSWQMDELKPRSVTSVIEVKGIDASASRQRDTQEFKPGTPLLFAEARSAMVDVLARADRVLVDGFWIARLAIQAPGATDLNLHFARVVLPPRAMLHIYDAEMAVFQGPLIPPRRQPKAAQALWTPVIPGESGLIEISWPASSDLPVVELAEIWVGYRDLFGTRGGPFLNAKAGTCNNDVVCIEGDPWRDEIRSVARYSVNGGLCTGTLVNDSDSSLTPYFLTAYHCGVSEATVAGMVFYWNYESPVCGQLGGGSLTQNQTGAIFRARRQDVDMALVELAAIPDQSFNVHYAGWDRSGDAPTGTVGIHHPRGDEKAISFSSQLLIQSNSCIISGTSNTHWTVPRWDDGTTEPGSSGSGIWHPQRQRVIGFLSGGGAACGNSLSDCYGRMDVAWDGADASSRLRDWLDPRSVSTPVGVDGADPFGFVIAVEPERISQCTREDARFAVSLAGVGGFSEEVTMSVAQAPGGTTTTFSVNPLSTDGSSELVIGNLADVDAGVYEMTLNAVSQSQSRQVTLGLTLFAGSPDAPVLSLPVSGSLGVNLFPNISWSAVADAIEYQVQIGLNGNFSNPVLDLITADTQLAVQSALAGDENYSVRVRAINSCGGGDWSTVGVFRTEAAYCKSPDLAIPDNSQDGVADVLDIATIGRLTDLEMVLVLEHTWIGDLIVRLVNQSTGTSIRLLENNNCNGNDIDVRIFDEAGRSLQTDCQSASIAYPEPSYSPLDALSAFDGEELAGGWTLQVSDNAAQDTGVLHQWCLIPKLQIETVFGDSFEREERL